MFVTGPSLPQIVQILALPMFLFPRQRTFSLVIISDLTFVSKSSRSVTKFGRSDNASSSDLSLSAGSLVRILLGLVLCPGSFKGVGESPSESLLFSTTRSLISTSSPNAAGSHEKSSRIFKISSSMLWSSLLVGSEELKLRPSESLIGSGLEGARHADTALIW